MSVEYADLQGAVDRQVLYRSERFRAKELLGPIPPEVLVGGVGFALHDISMSGLAIQTPANDSAPEVGSTVSFALGHDDETIYRGRGEVARVEPRKDGLRVGIRVLDGYLDVSEIAAVHRHRLLMQELDEIPLAHQLHVTPEYRKHCADVVFKLRRYRKLLERYEAEADGGDAAARQRFEEAFAFCAERFVADWRSLWRQGYAAVKPLLADRRAVAAAKRFTEDVVTPELLDGPIWKRSFEKPLGYPGDFQIMNYVYADDDRGDSAYARLCHRIGVEVGSCVRTRMEIVAEDLKELLSRDEGTCHVTSLGCGSAAEVPRVLNDPDVQRPAVLTLIDQDRDALSCAYRNIFPLVNEGDGQIELSCLHLSFGQLMGGASVIAQLPPQDFIYCVGLIDYLTERAAQMLVAALFSRLAPGGTLVIGNMKAGTDIIWPMTFILDWELIYRDEEEMYALAQFIKPAKTELRLDSTGYNYLMSMTAPKLSSV